MPDFCHFSAASLREGPCLCSNKVQARFILGLLPASEFNITFGTVPATFRWSSQDVELNMATLAWNPRAWGPSKPWDSGSDRAKAPVFLATSPKQGFAMLGGCWHIARTGTRTARQGFKASNAQALEARLSGSWYRALWSDIYRTSFTFPARL